MGTESNGLFTNNSQRLWAPFGGLERKPGLTNQDGLFPKAPDSRTLNAVSPATDTRNVDAQEATPTLTDENSDQGFWARLRLSRAATDQKQGCCADLDPVSKRYEEFAKANWPHPLEALRNGMVALGMCPKEQSADEAGSNGAFKWLRWLLMGEAVMFWGMLAYQYSTCTQRHECQRLINTMKNMQCMPKLLFWLTTSTIFGGTAVILSSFTEKLLAMLAAGFDKFLYGACSSQPEKKDHHPTYDTFSADTAGAVVGQGLQQDSMPPANDFYGTCGSFYNQECFEHCMHCPNARERFYDGNSCVCNQQVQQHAAQWIPPPLAVDEERTEFRRYLEGLQEFISRPFNFPEDPDALRERRKTRKMARLQQRQQQQIQLQQQQQERIPPPAPALSDDDEDNDEDDDVTSSSVTGDTSSRAL